MKTCPSCRQALPDDAKFCPMDGASLAGVPADPLLGSVIADRYVLLERVGQGNSGTIYRAEHVVLRQKIAVKLLHPELSNDQAAVDRFRQEAMTLAQLQSESIVRVSDFGVAEDGRVFFAMEYLEGEILGAALGREGRFGEQRALDLLQQVGKALAEAHALGYVHRDIRPRNIFLTRQASGVEQVKLLDFGLARLMEPSKGERTTLGHTLGDPRYLSPEQARGEALDARSDIYSLAIIAYEMVSGSPPFGGSGTVDVLTKHLEAQPVPLGEKASELSPAYAEAVTRALSKRAAERPSTVEAFLTALAGQPAPAEVEPAKTLLGTGLSGQQVLAAAGEISAEPKAQVKHEEKAKEKEKAKPAAQGTEQEKQANTKAAPVTARLAQQAAASPAATVKETGQPRAEGSPGKTGRGGKDPAATDPSVPEFHLPLESEIGSPYQENQPSESNNWFAQGVAAEHALEVKTASGPLPAIYETLEGDEEVLGRRFSPSMVIAVVVAVVAALLFVVIFSRDGDQAGKQASAAAGRGKEEGPKLQPAEPSAFRGGGGTTAIADPVSAGKGSSASGVGSAPPAAKQAAGVPSAPVKGQAPAKDTKQAQKQPAKQASKQPASKQPASKQPASKQPASKQPASKQPAAKQPAAKQPASKQPASKQPAAAGKSKEDVAKAAAQVQEGRASLGRADFTSARQSFTKALQLNPSQPAAHAGLGEVAFELGQYAAAAKHFNTALRYAPRDTRSMVMLGNSYFKLGRTQNAVEQYRKALQVDPQNAAARAGLQAAVRKLAGQSG